jgi:hypothetical protein
VTDTPLATRRTRAEQVRDVIMIAILAIWLTYGVLSVYQIFRDGSKVLDTLPPFWFWGIPLAPFSALYAPWGDAVRALQGGQPPEPPTPPEAPQ